MMDLEHLIASYSWKVLGVASIILILLAVISLSVKKPKAIVKKVLFLGIIAATIIPTLYLISSTIYLNSVSSSNGPVHWHADTEIWACGKELDFKDPIGWSNKIGTATLHEHNDKRIHLEGVVVNPEDASLGKFFRVIGGSISPTSLTVPTTEGLTSLQNGMKCASGEQGEVQVFVYQTDNEQYYTQQKVVNPENYIISPHSSVPAGDCIIVEFGAPKERTDKMCRSYKVAEQIGKLKGEKQYGN